MKNTGNIAMLLVFGLLIFIVIDKITNRGIKKIGIVQMEKLVYDFKGMKDATKKYEIKMTKWNGENDSIQTKLQSLYNEMKLDSIKKDFTKLKTDMELFIQYKKAYMDYAQKIEESAANEDKQMTIGVINQLNEYIKNFAEKENYDVILCNQPQSPAIGYAFDKIDVTKEILEYANKSYSGEREQ